MGDPETQDLTPETTPAETAAEAPPEPQPELAAPPPAAGPGPHYGTGRRKTSVARVYLRAGGGRVRINGRALEKFFSTPLWLKHAKEPLEFTGAAGQYDAEITVSGGGSSGQAGAVRMGLARALAVADPALRPRLRKAGFLTRDPRMKERKKYGQKGARKRFQWTKR